MQQLDCPRNYLPACNTWWGEQKGSVCAVAWGCSGHSLPSSPSCPPPREQAGEELSERGHPKRGSGGSGSGRTFLGKARGCRWAGDPLRELGAVTWCGGKAQVGIHDTLVHPLRALLLCSPRGQRQPFPSPACQTAVMQNGKCHFLVGSPEAPPGTAPGGLVGLPGTGGEGQPCGGQHPEIPAGGNRTLLAWGQPAVGMAAGSDVHPGLGLVATSGSCKGP